jgi:hypothetical protein
MTPALRDAWDRYRNLREELREYIFTGEMTQRPETHAAAVQVLLQNEAIAYEHIIAWRPDYPRWSVTWGEPMFYDVWKPCADFKYQRTWLDGRYTYRIWGKRGSAVFCDVQHRNKYYGDLPQAPLKNYSVSEWLIDDQGNFEVIASATKPESGHWLELDSNSRTNHLMTREALVDWDIEVDTTFHVERIDNLPSRPLVDTEADMIARLDAACLMLSYVGQNYNEAIFQRSFGVCNRTWNTFGKLFHPKDTGAHPEANYVAGVFNLQPDEALVFEMEVPECAYWGAHLADPVNRTIDYMYHRSSLNNAQTRIDADGKVRIVIAHKDPGVQNWLDTVGNQQGVCQLRFYKSKGMPVPDVKLVKLEEVRAVLPAETPTYSLEERTDELRRRTYAIMRRYNF